MKQRAEGAVVDAGGAAEYSRRNILKGSALLLAGGESRNESAAPRLHRSTYARRRRCPGSGPSSHRWRSERGPIRATSSKRAEGTAPGWGSSAS